MSNIDSVITLTSAFKGNAEVSFDLSTFVGATEITGEFNESSTRVTFVGKNGLTDFLLVTESPDFIRNEFDDYRRAVGLEAAGKSTVQSKPLPEVKEPPPWLKIFA